MTATFTTTRLAELHSQGHRFITQVEGQVTGLTHLLADDAHQAATLAKVWVATGSASAATYRILPNGKLNLIRFFDFNDVEVA